MIDEIRNGVPALLLGEVAWRKSSFSGAIGNCVEVAHLPGGLVAVRNSRNPAGPALVSGRDGLAALVAAAAKR